MDFSDLRGTPSHSPTRNSAQRHQTFESDARLQWQRKDHRLRGRDLQMADSAIGQEDCGNSVLHRA